MREGRSALARSTASRRGPYTQLGPFLQALGMFSAALASGQLGPLMCQFGLPAEAVEAANKGGKSLSSLLRLGRASVLSLPGVTPGEGSVACFNAFQMWKRLPKPCRTMPNQSRRRVTPRTRKTRRKT